MKVLSILAAVAVLLVAGCGGSTPAPTAVVVAPTEPTPTSVVEPTPTLVVEPTTAPEAPVASLTGEGIVELFKAAGLPIGAVVIYTAETDPNKLLGRPNQYIAKAAWHDTRVPAPTVLGEPKTSNGGGLEIYTDEAGARSRMEYLQAFGKKMPLLAEYDFVRGPILLRVAKDLTPDQADEYRAMLDTIPMP